MTHTHAPSLDARGRPAAVVTHGVHAHPRGPAAEPPPGPAPRLHVQGTFLPSGEPADAWIVDGRVTFEPVTGATTIARRAWILPGLVDAHCHVGVGPDGAGADRDATQAQALADRDTGALLLRDAGSSADTRWIDAREDLPRIIRAGRHLARPKRYLRNLGLEVEPDELVEQVRTQARLGDGWVKLVGDWIDRGAGDLTPLWPADVARAAIEAAHAEGARVTAHCFDEVSVAELVRAGIDGVEHGTGLDDATIATMAERGIALVPTLYNIETFPGIARAAQDKFPRYAAHMLALHARRFATVGKALDAGVPLYAGTDAGATLPHGLLASEIELLAKVGGAAFALGAASWRARSWLGRDGLTEGAAADLVVYTEDPRARVSVVREPAFVILRGRVVRSAGRRGAA